MLLAAGFVVAGAAYDNYVASKKHRKLLESAIVRFILPHLESPAPFLRLRACWAFAQYGDMEYTNLDNFKAGVAGILKARFSVVHLDEFVPGHGSGLQSVPLKS